MVRAPMKQDNRGSIGRTARVVGRLSGDGDLVVEGRIEGELSLRGDLHVAEGGYVAAPVEAGDLLVEGIVDGDVESRGAVVVRQTGTLRGAIRASRVGLDEGARFSGRIEMDVELPGELADTPAAPARGEGRSREGKRG
jgi:cytoskeletal protein CcmA (bactofilin family)